MKFLYYTLLPSLALTLLLLAGCSGDTGREIDDLDWVNATVMIPGASVMPPGGGWAYSDMAIVDRNILLLSGSHHIIRTTDGGETWSEVLTDTSLQINKMSQNCDGTIFAVARADDEQALMATILRSRDQGLTWRRVFQQEENVVLGGIDCREGGTVVTALRNSILTSEDGGESWREDSTIYGFRSESDVRLLEPAAGFISGLFLEQQPVLLRSDLAGTWSHVVLPEELRIMKLAPVNPDLLFAVIRNGIKVRDGIYRSQDGGSSWEVLPFSPARINGLLFIDTLTGIAVGEGHTPSSKIVSSGVPYGSLFRTTDGGRSWEGTMRFTGVWEFIDVECLDRSTCFGLTDSHIVRLDLNP